MSCYRFEDLARVRMVAGIGLAELESIDTTEGSGGRAYTAFLLDSYGRTVAWSLDLTRPPGQMQRAFVAG